MNRSHVIVDESAILLTEDLRMTLPKIMVVGYARHGKDSVGQILHDTFEFQYKEASRVIAEEIAFPALKDVYGYESEEECYQDRVNHRKEWYDLVNDYCGSDPTRFGRLVYSQSDVYTGVRHKREFHAMKNANVFQISIWVDRSNHEPPEDKSSNTIEPWMADFVIDNNGSPEDLQQMVELLMIEGLGYEKRQATTKTKS